MPPSEHELSPPGTMTAASPTEVDGVSPFTMLGLDATLVDAISALGYEEPTPIQRAAIPPLLAGRDVLGQAATGTGKTAAFALPLLQRISLGERDGEDGGVVRALVLVPTRELAMQVAEAIHKYGKHVHARVLPVYGGQDIRQQLRVLRRGVDVVVATPGRALDHIRRGSLDVGTVSFVVLDEADEMLDMGFAEDLDAILAALPIDRQTALFSATIAPRIAAIAERHLRAPERVAIPREKGRKGTLPNVRQTAYIVQRQHKVAALGRVLDMESPASAIVFCRTRTEVDELTETLGGHGYRAEALHGGLSQEQRDRVMRRFRDGISDLLVATDVAARGLDIEHVTHVVNFDVPSAPDAYVHRIGRTGRAGREGAAITLAEPREHRLLRNIEQLTKQKIAVETVPTSVDLRARRLELTRAALRESLVDGKLDEYRVAVESLAQEFDVLDVAAAAVKMAYERERGAEAAVQEIPAVQPPSEALRAPQGKREKRERPAKRDSREYETRESRTRRDGGSIQEDGRGDRHEKRSAKNKRRRANDTDVTRLYVGIGRKAGLRAADIVGAIANETSISPRHIGAVDIADRFALVEVPDDAADEIIAALRATTIRGKKVPVRRDRA
jgi:ATP-dependent RNA helicase DeaD